MNKIANVVSRINRMRINTKTAELLDRILEHQKLFTEYLTAANGMPHARGFRDTDPLAEWCDMENEPFVSVVTLHHYGEIQVLWRENRMYARPNPIRGPVAGPAA